MVQCDGAGGDCTSSALSTDSNRVGYWQFEEGSGTTTADSSGTGNTGTLTNGPVWTTGYFGNGLQFDGTNDKVVVAAAASINDMAAFTICAWSNPTTGANGTPFYQVASKYNAAFTRGWDFYNAGKGTSERGVGFMEVFPIDYNAWHHYCATNDGSALKLYQDSLDISVGQGNFGSALSDAAFPLNLGNDAANSDPFKGKLDEIRLYNRVLTQAEIAEINNYNPSGCGNPSGVAGDIIYNSTYHVMQACTPAGWRAIGPSGVGGGVYTTPALVQSTTFTQNAGGTFTLNKTFGATPSTGNYVIVTASSYSDTVDCDVVGNLSISDNYGNTYTLAVSAATAGGTGFGFSSGIWYARIVTSGAGFQVTATDSTCDYVSLGLIEASGIAATSPVDKTAFYDLEYASAFVLNGGFTTVPNQFAVSMAVNAPGFAYTKGAEWMDLTTDAWQPRVYQILTAIQNISIGWDIAGAEYSNGVLATFKGAFISSGCTSPTGVEGDLLYNSTSSKVQYCNGAGWITGGP